MAKTVSGKCRLCHRDGLPIQNSHILPGWLYKRLRNEVPGGNPNTIEIRNGKPTSTFRQYKKRLLCVECEGRFSRREDYVSRLVYQKDGTVPMLGMLDVTIRQTPSGQLRGAARLRLDDIAYYGVSIVWREHEASPGSTLGADNAEAMRLFLLGESSFPANTSVALMLLDDRGHPSGFHGLCSMPSLKDLHGSGVLSFDTCGLRTVMFIGECMPQSVLPHCVVRGESKCVFVFDAHKVDVSDDLAKLAAWWIWSSSRSGR